MNTFVSQHWQTNARVCLLTVRRRQREDDDDDDDEKQMWLPENDFPEVAVRIQHRTISLVNIDTSVIVGSLD